MSTGEIVRFDGDFKANAGLREEIEKCGVDPAKVVLLANAKGYNFTKDELVAYSKEQQAKLDDSQLDKIAGGIGGPGLTDPTGVSSWGL